MDPNATWQELLQAAKDFLNTYDSMPDADLQAFDGAASQILTNGIEMAHAVEALSEWLSKGGFPPEY